VCVYVGLSSASCSSAEMVTVGQIGNYGYGSVPMEKSFRVSYGHEKLYIILSFLSL